MILRQAIPSDIDIIMDIERDAFIPAICETQDTFAERIAIFPEGFLLLQDDGGSVCGYFASERWNCVHTERAFFELGHSAAQSHKQDGSVLYISSMGILSSHRGTGLGKYLFSSACSRICRTCAGITKIALLVNEAWKGAHHIYEQAGFSEIARLTGFFPAKTETAVPAQPLYKENRTDGIIMERTV